MEKRMSWIFLLCNWYRENYPGREENERLTLALESGSGLPDDVKATRKSDTAYLYEDEPKQSRAERKAELASLGPSLTSSTPRSSAPEPTKQEERVEVDVSLGGVEVSASVDEATF